MILRFTVISTYSHCRERRLGWGKREEWVENEGEGKAWEEGVEKEKKVLIPPGKNKTTTKVSSQI